jgi:mannitol/fructose-specific phosphotransferase system IIA component
MMAILSIERVRLKTAAADRSDAIRQAGELLVQSGCVSPAYIDGMLAREGTMSTYLGSGVSIPHGIYENREDIFHTGISVVQIPAGVDWGDGDTAYLVIGIAASSDEHVGVLASLAEAIEDEDTIHSMIETSDPEFILKCLTEKTAA